MSNTFFDHVWASLAQRGRTFGRFPSTTGPEIHAAKLALELCSERGEATAATRAGALVELYRGLTTTQQHAFHVFIARNFRPDQGKLEQAAKAYLSTPTSETAAELSAASEPPRRELLRRINIAAGGTKVLVEMRQALIKAVADAPDLRPLEQDLHYLLTSWFNPGFLELRRIDWNTPAAILEKLITYEAVHEINGWNDLRRRVAPDRRCYAFFHRALPEEPLIFVEVALCEGLASEIAPLLATNLPQEKPRADTAVFYSISNCQPGLRKISFGSFLIKRVVEELRTELPWLKHFATLSPISNFRRWLERHLEAAGQQLLTDKERAALGEPAIESLKRALAASMRVESDEAATSVIRPILERLCASYLTASNDGHGPEDPVARFHLSNGARVERINWRANIGPRGISESFGLMVNYRYELGMIETNHEKFVNEGSVAHSAEVGELLKGTAKRSRNRNPRLRGDDEN